VLDNKGFDLWADGYDKTVLLSEESNEYPFAGYKDVLNIIYQTLQSKKGKVLDIGFGTGILTCKLYEDGYSITGIDFSKRMIEIAHKKMPMAKLIPFDFTGELPKELENQSFDWIVGTYSIHHLSDEQKKTFIDDLMNHLVEDGMLVFGDVAFETDKEMIQTKERYQNRWDEDEFYLVFDRMVEMFPYYTVNFMKVSFCSGVITISR
jgi:putative AdoMet-dependent methyltransferase